MNGRMITAVNGTLFGAILVMALAESTRRPPSYLLCGGLGCVAIAALSKGGAAPWAKEAFAICFLFCAIVASAVLVRAPMLSQSSHTYFVRPATFLVGLGCLLRLFSAARQPLTPWAKAFLASATAAGAAAATSYFLLARHYALDLGMLVDTLRNLAIVVGGYVAFHGLFTNGAAASRRFRAALTLTLVAATLAAFIGRHG